MKLTKRAYGWPEDAQFLVPDGVRERFDEGIGKRGAELRAAWEQTLDAYAPSTRAGGRDRDDAAAPAARRLGRRDPLLRGRRREGPRHPQGLEQGRERDRRAGAVADRRLRRPHRLDLGPARPSTAPTNFEPGSFGGRQIHFGIREHAAAAACNGLSLCKLRPLWSTYLTFSDYGRPGIRLSALMELPVIHLFTHDSIGLGEDGPTHQPIEQLASLRAMPHLDVIRPADANEVAEAWRLAVDRTHNPVALVLTRQTVPVFDRSKLRLRRGGAARRLRARRLPRAATRS